jgi:hypothetical protein
VKNAIQKATCEIQAFALGFIIYSALFLAHVGSFGACTDCTTSLASPMPASSLVSPRILKKLTANLRKQLLECAVETVSKYHFAQQRWRRRIPTFGQRRNSRRRHFNQPSFCLIWLEYAWGGTGVPDKLSAVRNLKLCALQLSKGSSWTALGFDEILMKLPRRALTEFLGGVIWFLRKAEVIKLTAKSHQR